MKIPSYSIHIPGWKIIHFNGNKKIGESRQSCSKGLVHRDRLRRVEGRSIRNFFGELNHYDRKGYCVGYSRYGGFATIIHYGSRGLVEGRSFNIFGIVYIHRKVA